MRTMLAVSLAVLLIAAGASADAASDTEHLADVMNQRLETQRTGVEVRWMNPSTGNGGIVIILQTNESDPERPCRTYRRTTEIPGQPEIVVEGNACRIAPSIWQRSEAPVPQTLNPEPAARAAPEPPSWVPPSPPHKPDPNVFYASTPVPSVY